LTNATLYSYCFSRVFVGGWPKHVVWLLLLLLLLPPGNGLFTSSTFDKDWQVAHGLLPRSFNQIRVKNYFGVSRLVSCAALPHHPEPARCHFSYATALGDCFEHAHCSHASTLLDGAPIPDLCRYIVTGLQNTGVSHRTHVLCCAHSCAVNACHTHGCVTSTAWLSCCSSIVQHCDSAVLLLLLLLLLLPGAAGQDAQLCVGVGAGAAGWHHHRRERLADVHDG
jgi:hypothetical protein